MPFSPQRMSIRFGSTSFRAVQPISINKCLPKYGFILNDLPLAHWYALWAYASFVLCSTCHGPQTSLPSAQYLTYFIIRSRVWKPNGDPCVHCKAFPGHSFSANLHSRCYQCRCNIQPNPLLIDKISRHISSAEVKGVQTFIEGSCSKIQAEVRLRSYHLAPLQELIRTKMIRLRSKPGQLGSKEPPK